jgi:acyl carrier protein
MLVNLKNFLQEAHTVFEKLKALLMDELQIDEADITLDAKLSTDLGINSIELADLVMLCEEKFDIEIEDADIHDFVTVGDVVKYLETL